jgi:hypothetical protein
MARLECGHTCTHFKPRAFRGVRIRTLCDVHGFSCEMLSRACGCNCAAVAGCTRCQMPSPLDPMHTREPGGLTLYLHPIVWRPAACPQSPCCRGGTCAYRIWNSQPALVPVHAQEARGLPLDLHPFIDTFPAPAERCAPAPARPQLPRSGGWVARLRFPK